MVDPFGRSIRYLRVSVTDRCDLRCFYCMSEDMTFLPKADLLTLEEPDRLIGHMKDLPDAVENLLNRGNRSVPKGIF